MAGKKKNYINNDNDGVSEDNKNKNIENDDKSETNPFTWVSYIDVVSETQRCSWSKVYDMNILEFFNTISYAIYKNKKQEEALNKYRRTH